MVTLPTLPRFAVLATTKSETFALLKLAVFPSNSRFTVRLGTTTLPLKLAVLPLISAFTSKLLTCTLPLKLAVLPLNSVLTVKFGTITLPLKFAVFPSNACVALIVPDTLIPVPVTVNTLELALTEITTLPFAVGMLTLDVPFSIEVAVKLAQLKLPLPLVVSTCPLLPPVIITLPTLPKLAVLDTTKLPIVALLKLAVLPSNSRFTVKFGTTTLPLKLAVFPSSACVALIVPVTFTPVPVITNTVLPAEEMVTLPLAAGIDKLLVPFDITLILLILTAVFDVINKLFALEIDGEFELVLINELAVILPVAIISPLVPKLPTFALPVAFNVPATLIPVPVTTTTFALPTAEILTLPLAAGISTLLLPLLILLVLTDIQLKLPLPLVERTCPLLPPVIMTLPTAPRLATPATTNPVVPRFPTLALPVAFNVPVTFTPVPVTTNIFELPADPKLILLFAVNVNALLLVIDGALVLVLTNEFAVTFPLNVPSTAFKLLVILILPALAISPTTDKFATFALPVVCNVPATLIPVPVTTNTFALPSAEMLTFPLAAGISTLLLPLLILLVLIAAQSSAPLPFVCKK